jgi:Domain of unknown function (DUF4328)
MSFPSPLAGPDPFHGMPYPPGYGYEPFVRLGWRTVAASIAIVAVPTFSVGLDLTEILLADRLRLAEPDMASAFVLFAVASGYVGALVVAAVFHGIWLHRAARNLAALGREGMKFSPGWCVASFYVPFVNLFRPAMAVAEVWRASDPGPQADGGAWRMVAASSTLVGLWWSTWLASTLLSNVASRIPDPRTTGYVGLAGSVLMAIAAHACVRLMRSIEGRQDQAAMRLGMLTE